MKKIYSFALIFAATASFAQSGIPNGNFESWTSGTADELMYYSTSNQQAFYQSGVFNCLKVANPYHGSFAVQLNTVAVGNDTSMAFIVNSPNPSGGNPCQWPGGIACTQAPTGIRGYYKNNSVSIDSSGILVAFKKNGSCLGVYMYKFGGVHNAYTPFQFTFNPPIVGTPDTMIFAAVSSDVFNNVQRAGNMLQLDSVSLTGITQPTNFNGDFELWQPKSYEKPNNWYVNSNGGGNSNTGVLKTTDMKAGSFAAQLTTVGGTNKSNVAIAQGARISTGYYPNCNGPCNQIGGYPFTNQMDTLYFYYKYTPSGNDTATADLLFKKAGNTVWQTSKFIYTPSSTYQLVPFAFNTMTPIDTVIVSFQSSNWRDSAVSFIGSVLKIDEAHFASQPLNTGIKLFDASVGVKVFPNPSSDGAFTVSNVERFDLVRVLNMYGQEMNAEIVKENGVAKIHMDTPGAYIVYINARGKVSNLKVLVGKE